MQLPEEQQQRLRSIGWRPIAIPASDEADAFGTPRMARVIAQHRNGYRVHDGITEFAAQPAPRFLRRAADPQLRPAVGDFVLIGDERPPVIQQILTRRTVLVRAAAGERYQ